jgi:TATA-box binding protein (TBP) (component of TFIID and TFIIIB)
MDIDNEWQQFLDSMDGMGTQDTPETSEEEEESPSESTTLVRNKCEDLYISTQTKIFFLNQTNINVFDIFWNMDIVPYASPNCGVIKKQMRIVFKDKDEFNVYQEKLKTIPYYTEKIMKQIDNPNARKIKFKDVRKITIGVSKKDIMNCHGKNKNAFINCFAIILRVKHNNQFHEIHVKVFNTGKMAIPGIVDDDLMEQTKELLLSILQPNFTEPLQLIPACESALVKRLVKGKKDSETGIKTKSHFEYVQPKGNVLINSNFNCGYYIQQEKLRAVLRDKYNLNPSYDPSMYPGVKCKFYYKNRLEPDDVQDGILLEHDQNATLTELNEMTQEKYTKVSFMIFRTGNCLIVGNCSKEILMFVFEYVKKILMDEYETIRSLHDIPVVKMKQNKPRKKAITFSKDYFDTKVVV